MGWLDTLFGSNDQTQVKNTSFYPQVESGLTYLTSSATEEAKRPYTTYTGPRVAGTNAWYDQGEIIAQNTGLRATNALDKFTGGWKEADRATYMNPFLNDVLAPAQQNLDEQYAQALNKQRAESASRGAFGGSRGAIMEGQTTEAYFDSSNELNANARFNAYNDAYNRWSGDRSGIADTYQDMLTLGAQPLMSTGANRQALEQRNLDTAYQDFTAQNQYNKQNLGWLNNILQGSPSSLQTTTMQTQGAEPNRVGQTLGAVGGLATAGLGRETIQGVGSWAGDLLGSGANWISNGLGLGSIFKNGGLVKL